RNIDDGLHIAGLAGAWMAAVAGFGGMRDHGGRITFAPRLPPALSRLCFRMTFSGRVLLIEIRRPAPDGDAAGRSEQATYRLLGGEPLRTWHHGEAIDLHVDTPVTRPVPAPPEVTPVHQPAGRAPEHRSPPDAADLP
ncbi:MAG: glycosyl hydrolase family 65 protein, partial [Acidimicrobiales bacterium]